MIVKGVLLPNLQLRNGCHPLPNPPPSFGPGRWWEGAWKFENWEIEMQEAVEIFISHSHADSEIAEAFG